MKLKKEKSMLNIILLLLHIVYYVLYIIEQVSLRFQIVHQECEELFYNKRFNSKDNKNSCDNFKIRKHFIVSIYF